MTWFHASAPRTRLLLLTALIACAYAPAAHAQGKKKRDAAAKDAPVTVQAERIHGRADRKVQLERDVEVTRADTVVRSEHALYDAVEDEILADGNVRIQRAGDSYTGQTLQLNLESGKGRVLNPTYRLELNNAQGSASRVEFESEDQATVYDGTYSTCEAPDADWYLAADTLSLDMGRDIGWARRATLYFKGVPIIPGIPALSFPLSSERKSGLLPPVLGSTSRGGIELTLPYYFNIAPNRDATLSPKLVAKRGVQLGGQIRYLGQGYAGVTNAEFLPHDRQVGRNRYAITSHHSQVLAPSWTYGWDLNTASDNEYPGDFANSIIQSNQRLLVRELRTDYVRPFWSASARVQNYQLLQDPEAGRDPTLRIGRPYDRLPQISFYASRYDVHGFDWSAAAEVTRFWHPDLVRGTRAVLNPQISYPVLRPGYFITPKLSLHASRYELDGNNPAGRPDSLTRTVPTFSLDSGMVFERDSTLLGRAVTQTLEPRLFYVYTPWRDQTLFPNFDSADASFNFAQLFSENRFIGNDRIGDANQLTAALVSRYIEPNGTERLRLAVGQRFYFEPPRVGIAGNGASTLSRSDLLLAAGGRITADWGVDSLIQYSQSERRVDTATHTLQWQPGPKRVLNAEYRYVRGSFEQFSVSGQWPVARRWYAVGRVSRSLPEGKTVDNLFGVEYKADCWAFRLVSQRYATTTRSNNTALFIQLELTGLARIGPNPLDVLARAIPGYQRTTNMR